MVIALIVSCGYCCVLLLSSKIPNDSMWISVSIKILDRKIFDLKAIRRFAYRTENSRVGSSILVPGLLRSSFKAKTTAVNAIAARVVVWDARDFRKLILLISGNLEIEIDLIYQLLTITLSTTEQGFQAVIICDRTAEVSGSNPLFSIFLLSIAKLFVRVDTLLSALTHCCPDCQINWRLDNIVVVQCNIQNSVLCLYDRSAPFNPP